MQDEGGELAQQLRQSSSGGLAVLTSGADCDSSTIAPTAWGAGSPELTRVAETRFSVANDAEGTAKRHINRHHLGRAWDTQQRTTADDWRDWMRTSLAPRSDLGLIPK